MKTNRALAMSRISKGKLIAVAVVLVFMAAGATAKYAQVVMTDEVYCLTCHARQRYVALWQKSEVHPDIACGDCHANAEKVLKFDLSADQKVTNANCVRCHRDVSKARNVVFKFNKFQIKIPHDVHVKKKILCTKCHSNIRHERGMNGTYRPKMASCFSCHAKEKTSCTQCHRRGSLELPHQTHIDEVECTKCHHGYEEKEFEIYGVTFSHEPHNEDEVACEKCHSNATKHGQITRRREGCEECHEL